MHSLYTSVFFGCFDFRVSHYVGRPNENFAKIYGRGMIIKKRRSRRSPPKTSLRPRARPKEEQRAKWYPRQKKSRKML